MDKTAERKAFITVLAIFSMGQIAGSIDAAIALIGQAFSLSSAMTMYVSSIAALASVATGLAVGFVAGKKLSYRSIVYFAGACVLAGGLVPFFVNNYGVLLVFRAVFGIGFGGMMSLQNTFAALTLSKEKQAAVLGIGIFVGYGTNCVLQLVGGFLADISWHYVFLNHILLAIPFVLILICCPNIPKARAIAAEEEKKKASFPAVVVVMCVLMGLVGLLISPLLIGCSFLSANITTSATVAGVVAVCFSLGCMVGGVLYPMFYKKLGRFCFTCFLVIATVGVGGSAMARSIPLLCVTIFLGGMGFSSTQAGAMMVTGLTTEKSSVALASALIMACFNLGMFLCALYAALYRGSGISDLCCLFPDLQSIWEWYQKTRELIYDFTGGSAWIIWSLQRSGAPSGNLPPSPWRMNIYGK